MQGAEPSVFRAYYDEPYNAIVMPHLPQHYFRKRWMPELGPLATCIVLFLRGVCLDSKEKTMSCEVKYEVIAQGVGVSTPTIKREMKTHQQDDPINGFQKGDFLNPVLQHFIQARHVKNLTDSGIRNGANEYLVRLDDPIHPEDMAFYELLCKQQKERDKENGGTPQTQIRDRRTSSSGSKSPGDQNDTQAPKNQPGDQSDTQALREKTVPGYQNDTYTSNVFVKNGITFNVKGEDIDTKTTGESTRTEADGTGPAIPVDLVTRLVGTYVSKILDITKDTKSERRYYQLVGICEKNNCLSIIDVAMRATQAGIDAGTVPKPGAYLQKIVLKKLADRGIHVPTAQEKAEAPKVAGAIRAGLEEDLGKGTETPARQSPSAQAPRSAVEPVDELAQIAALEQVGGEEWVRWQQFLEARREQYREMVKMPTQLNLLLTALEEPQQQRSLWKKWKGLK